jgi:hypothetical protein
MENIDSFGGSIPQEHDQLEMERDFLKYYNTFPLDCTLGSAQFDLTCF